MKVIFGDMEFGTFSVHGDMGTPMCLVHKVQAVLDLPNEEAADALLGPEYDSYIIPRHTPMTIVYATGALTDIA